MDNGCEWVADGPNIVSPDSLAAVRHVLEDVGPVIVEHWFYYGSRSPDRLVFEDYEEFLEYLKSNARPGDSIWVWEFPRVCCNDNTLVNGKYPDEQGRVPKGGAY